MPSSGNKVQSPVVATGSMNPSTNSLREVFLEKYFHMLSDFNYDQARERAERERDSYKTTVNSWTMLVHALVHLVTDEKAYMSLSFLGPKWFTRPKDNLRHSYQSLTMEFQKIRETLHHQPDPLSSFDALLAHLCEQLERFPVARLRTMDLYEQLTTIGSNRNFNYEDPVMVGREIVADFQKSFHHPLLSPIKASFNLECEVIQHLLTTQILISELDYLPALLQLHQAHTKLASWGSCLPAREPKRSAFIVSANRHGNWPALYTWLTKYKNLLLSKFSIYFYETISRNANSSSEMRSLCCKLPEDYYVRINNFEKKADIFVFMIVADTNGLNHCYTSHGYFHPKRSMPKPQGINSYPSIFKYPPDRNVQKHWPNILMMINGKKSYDISTQEKVVWFYDRNAHSTYFISLVEPRISLVVITDGKRSERDSPISNFLTEFTTQLRCSKHFAALKPG